MGVETTKQLKTDLDQIKQAAMRALEYAKQQGAHEAEVGLSRQQGLSVATRDASIETVEYNQDGALGVTVYVDQCKGNASTADLSPAAIQKAVDAAMGIARLTQKDTCHGLLDSAFLAEDIPDLGLCFAADLTADQLAAVAIEAEQAAMDAGATKSDGAEVNAHYGVHVYGNSHGFLEGYLSSRYSSSMVAIATEQDKMRREYDYSVARQWDQLRPSREIGEQAAKKAIATLGARSLKTQSLPVLFHRDIAGGLFRHFVSAIQGSSVYRQSSFLMNHMGKQIFPTWLSITEDPHLQHGLASKPYDSEGMGLQKRSIIHAGQLETFLLSAYSARKLKLHPTGHAGGIANWQVSHQDLDFEQLLAQMDTGILVTDVMGQGVNTVTGDYSRGAAGFYVEKGQIVHPVEEVTIAGNLQTMFEQIVAIDNQPNANSSLQVGSVLIENMKVAGN